MFALCAIRLIVRWSLCFVSCFLIVRHFSKTFLIVNIIQLCIVIMYSVIHVKHLLYLSHINWSFVFSTDYRKWLKYQISWECVRIELRCPIRVDGETKKMKLIFAFRNFAQVRNKQIPFLLNVLTVLKRKMNSLLLWAHKYKFSIRRYKIRGFKKDDT
jgi:hypothetical protein